jgi:FAD/FMN-containing dehydrogenase
MTMDRRRFLKGLTGSAAAFFSRAVRPQATAVADPVTAGPLVSRVRPGHAGWPEIAEWHNLNRRVGGRLLRVESPWTPCANSGDPAACDELFRELKNPYYLGDHVGLTQTTGWVDAWTSQPSVFAVAAETTTDVVAAVDFAGRRNLRLVVKGGGHSYLGRSNAPDSLLIWTRRMNAITLHDAFVARGCDGRRAAQPAVSIGAGAIWGEAYRAVTTEGGRYVQGGGCLTVGVAGLVQAGGFGSFSKQFGTAAANLLEAEVVTADGAVRIVSECSHPDLFWGLKGGGGGSLGVVTRLTLRTYDLPAYFGGVHAVIRAVSADAFHRLIARFLAFYAENLFNPHWGDAATTRHGNLLDIGLTFQGLDHRQAEAIWAPFFEWVAASRDDYTFSSAPQILAVPARRLWDAAYLTARVPAIVKHDDRPGAPQDHIFWTANSAEAGHFIYGYDSLWLPRVLLQPERRENLTDAIFTASRRGTVELHFQKGLAGGSEQAIAATGATATNPKVLDAFALAIISWEAPPSHPAVPGHEPDLAVARRAAGEVGTAMNELKALAPDGGSYFAESNFFEPAWQTAYWGSQYARLRRVKQRYDPGGLFFVHHGAGTEGWSADGFTRVTIR